MILKDHRHTQDIHHNLNTYFLLLFGQCNLILVIVTHTTNIFSSLICTSVSKEFNYPNNSLNTNDTAQTFRPRVPNKAIMINQKITKVVHVFIYIIPTALAGCKIRSIFKQSLTVVYI